jgi:uncharacterized membrane-anchored protein
MRRAFVSFLVVTFSIFCHVIGQSTPTAQKLVDDVVAKYGGKALDATNFRLNGVGSATRIHVIDQYLSHPYIAPFFQRCAV